MEAFKERSEIIMFEKVTWLSEQSTSIKVYLFLYILFLIQWHYLWFICPISSVMTDLLLSIIISSSSSSSVVVVGGGGGGGVVIEVVKNVEQ